MEPDPGRRCPTEVGHPGTRSAEELEDGTLDPDELDREPTWWDERSDDED
jgi:hypothetical protein